MTLPKLKQRKSEMVSIALSTKGTQITCNKAFKAYRK